MTIEPYPGSTGVTCTITHIDSAGVGRNEWYPSTDTSKTIWVLQVKLFRA